MDLKIFRLVSGLIHIWKFIRYEFGTCICTCHLKGQIVFSPDVLDNTMALSDVNTDEQALHFLLCF